MILEGLALEAVKKLGIKLIEKSKNKSKTLKKVAGFLEDFNIKEGSDIDKLSAKETFDLRKTILESDVKLAEINAEDRNSARNREIQRKDSTPAILGSSIMLGFFGILSLLLFYTVPEENKAIFNIMLGALGTMATGVVSYYFGSSAGSRAKDFKIKQ